MSEAGKLPICVALPVRNEAAALPACLERLGPFAEVVVIDSNSTDGTAEIARKHGASVVQFAWDGRYPKKRNWFLANHPPSQPWVMFLDADEHVTEAFVAEARAATADPRIAAYWVRYRNHFLGRPLDHGLGQRKLALFRVGLAEFERIEEDRWSDLDIEVHEHPIVDGPVGELRARIEHHDDRGLEHFLRKHMQYAAWEARRFLALDATPGARRAFTRRQRFKYRHLHRWWFPGFYFVFAYVLKLGFLDGAAGLHLAFYKAWYFHTIRLLIHEHRAAGGGLGKGGAGA